MVLQCGASVAALPEHEEMIFTASVEVSGVGLVGSRLLRAAVAYSRGCCGHLHYRVAQSLIRAIMRLNSAAFTLVSSCPYLILFRHGKIKPVRRCFIPHGLTYRFRRQARNLHRFRASQLHSSNKDGGAGSGMIENSTLGR